MQLHAVLAQGAAAELQKIFVVSSLKKYRLAVVAAQTEQVGEDALEVERIYALRRFKRQGLGTLMMERAMNEAANRGLNTVWLGVWEHNVAAQRFYERLGFSVFGSHVFTLGDDEQTDLLMKRAV